MISSRRSATRVSAYRPTPRRLITDSAGMAHHEKFATLHRPAEHYRSRQRGLDASTSDQDSRLLLDRVRDTFEVDETVVSSLPEDDGHLTAAERPRARTGESVRHEAEYLLPRIVRRIQREWPPFTREDRRRCQGTRDELAARVAQLSPWSVPFRLGHGLSTMPEDDRVTMVAASRILFRRDLITGTLAALLGADLPPRPCSISAVAAASSLSTSPTGGPSGLMAWTFGRTTSGRRSSLPSATASTTSTST